MQWQSSEGDIMKLKTARELFEAHGIPRGTIYRLAKAGIIPSYKMGVKGRGLRFNAEEVLQALRKPAKAETKS
jgi:excisionase family DNA binding protein